MLATQMPDAPPEAKDVQLMKEKLAQCLKALQKRYITSDAVVTSEDADANLLCCALEAVFIHGIKGKFISAPKAGGRNRKGARGPLPQPFFWSLLKTVTHRDVVRELEKISFVSTDVGRCRAWLRLALNHGLLECYLASLFREDSKLRVHYQPSALLLDPEEREVLLSYLQGLASLTFHLSYKSAVLNEWTATPLALAGLCPLSQSDALDPPPDRSPPKESWDSASQSSGSSDAADPQRPLAAAAQNGRAALNSSSLSLDTSVSSLLSSSQSSDSLLQVQDLRSPGADQWTTCDLDLTGPVSAKRPQKELLSEFRESGHCSQDSMREDSFVSSAATDPSSEAAGSSGSDGETQGPAAPAQDPKDQTPAPPPAPAPSPDPPSSEENHVHPPPTPAHNVNGFLDSDTEERVNEAEVRDNRWCVQEEKEENEEMSVHPGTRRSTSILSRKLSTESFSHSRSWISEDDIYKPQLEEVLDQDEAPPAAPPPQPKVVQSPPSVVHRRQIGLSNPFRGLLKLGHLERRGPMGLWRDLYCELSPLEFRLYSDAEERTCCENCSLLRCEDARVTSPDGRFELAFPGKRLHLRAADRGEAEDWVDRVAEAVDKCRPAPRIDDWEVLQPLGENGADERALSSSASSTPSTPERGAVPSGPRTNGGVDAPPPPPPPSEELDWSLSAEVETDAVKEAVLFYSVDADARTWAPLIFSLSLEALKGFQVQGGRKYQRLSRSVQEIRDVVPDVSQGGAAFFKLLTVKDTLRLRAQSAEEARSWRVLIRGALDSYLESGEDEACEEPALRRRGVDGNLYRLVQHRLKGDGALLPHLCTVPSERGLDAQGFKCAGCPQLIGPSRGRARLCEFTGQYYCSSCHHGDTSIIPSRMVHNWDLAQREVCTKALQLLAEVEQEPLLNLEQLNPELSAHSEYMAQTDNLRQRLRLLGDYLLTCRSGAYKKLQARMGQRTYLLESSQLFSVMDLRQIAEEQYALYLMTLLQSASTHVFQCDLCTQRGFICQICHASDTIFPFQFDSTTRCKDCKAVFHLACKAPGASCPRCERMKRYRERDLQD